MLQSSDFKKKTLKLSFNTKIDSKPKWQKATLKFKNIFVKSRPFLEATLQD